MYIWFIIYYFIVVGWDSIYSLFLQRTILTFGDDLQEWGLAGVLSVRSSLWGASAGLCHCRRGGRWNLNRLEWFIVYFCLWWGCFYLRIRIEVIPYARLSQSRIKFHLFLCIFSSVRKALSDFGQLCYWFGIYFLFVLLVQRTIFLQD
jgi:hypothetical protein